MADQEVIKHTKKVYKIWNSKAHSPWQKIKEFLIEIFIIVFAVSLSIWLHDKSEHNHQQKVVKEFLLGLKGDLQNDIKEMKQDKEIYNESKLAFKYISGSSRGFPIQPDSLKYYQRATFAAVGLVLNDGRYEGFKSSGNIGNIENATLQNDVVEFYQEDIRTLILTTNYFSARKEKFFDYYLNNFKREKDSNNLISVVSTNVVQNYAGVFANSTDEITGRYQVCIDKANKIILEIDKEYKKH